MNYYGEKMNSFHGFNGFLRNLSLKAGKNRGPFNQEARKTTGFSKLEMLELAASPAIAFLDRWL
jgi:hypothetical protein